MWWSCRSTLGQAMTDEGKMLEAYRRVLIVEDEPRLSELYGRMMPELGYRAMTVSSGEAALEAMKEEAWPILLLDLNLPGMSGLECLKQVRGRWADTQAIVLTGFGDLEAAKEAIHLDVVEFLTKPCHLGDLEVALDRAQKRIRKLVIERLGDEVAVEQQVEQAPVGEGVGEPAGYEGEDEDRGPASLAELERNAILDALARHDGNRRAAADELGISVRTLYYRLDEYRKQGYMS